MSDRFNGKLKNILNQDINPATTEKQDTGNTSLTSLDTKLPSGLVVTAGKLQVQLPAGGSGLTDAELRATAVPISATALPLPSGASTEATISAINTKIPSGLTVTANRLQVELPSGGTGLTNTELRATPVPVSGTVAVTGVSTEATLALIKAKTDNIDVALSTRAVTGLTDAQIRATALPISGTVTVSNPTTNPETGLAKDGTDITTPSPAMPAGGVGIRGWLSAIWTKLNASLAVTGTFWQATQPVSGTFFQGTQPVSLATAPTTPVTGTFFQATQPVSGTVAISTNAEIGIVTEVAPATDTASSGLNGRLQRIAQRITSLITALGSPFQAGGSIGNTAFIANAGTNLNTSALALDTSVNTLLKPANTLAAVTTVSTVTNLSQMGGVAISLNTGVRDTGTQRVTIATNDVVPVTGTFWQATQPTSTSDITSSGTITALNGSVALALNGQSGATIQITGTWVATLQFEGTLDGTNWSTINGVYAGTSTPGPTISANGLVRLTPSGIAQFRITATAFTSGTATISMRASSATGGTFLNQSLTSGTNIIGKVGIDQTTPGTTNLVALAANQSVNTSQINGVTPLMGNGVTGTGSQRVTIASDNTAFPVNATLSAETTKVIGTVNQGTSPWVTSNATTSVVGNGAAATAQRVTLANDSTGIIATVSAVTAITNALPVGANVIGALTANQSVNIAQIAGVATSTGSGVTGTGVQRVVLATDVILPAVSEIRAATLHITATAAVNTAITATLPAPAAGLFHYITEMQLVKLYAVVGVASGAGVLITTTNLPGSPIWTTEQLASAAGSAPVVINYRPTTPLKSAVAATATTFVAPLQLQTIWRWNISYFTAA